MLFKMENSFDMPLNYTSPQITKRNETGRTYKTGIKTFLKCVGVSTLLYIGLQVEKNPQIIGEVTSQFNNARRNIEATINEQTPRNAIDITQLMPRENNILLEQNIYYANNRAFNSYFQKK